MQFAPAPQAFALRQQTRAMLLSALFNQTSVEDGTVDTVTSWVSSVRTLSRIPDLLDAAALRHLIDMLSTVVFTSPETSTPLEVVTSLVESINALLVGINQAKDVAITGAQLSALMQGFGRAITVDHYLGQQRLDLIRSELRMVMNIMPTENDVYLYAMVPDTSIVVPQNGLEMLSRQYPTTYELPRVRGEGTSGYGAISYTLKGRSYARPEWYSNFQPYRRGLRELGRPGACD